MDLILTMLVPLIIAVVALYGMLRRVDVYDALVQGAGDGLGVLIRIVPPLIGLLTAVYMLRASGALELAGEALSPVLARLGIPQRPSPCCWSGRSAAAPPWGWGPSSSRPMGRTPSSVGRRR